MYKTLKFMLNQKIKHIRLLDCTLRDGGYYNNWDFDDILIKKYLTEIEKSNIRDVEIGFRFYDQKYFLGPLAYTTDNFLNKLNIPKKIKVCVMVNSGDLLKGNNKKLNQLFGPKNKSRVDTIRFATHFREIKLITPYLKEAHRLGYKVIVNLMQANDRSETEIQLASEDLTKTNCVSVLYFADSLGKMKPPEISYLFQTAKKYWKSDLGIHTHDNKGLALLNCIEAIKTGVKWIDATILGMGRGAGNIQTEIFLAEIASLKNNKYKLEPIYRLSEGPFSDLKKKYNWGKSLNYYLAADYNIHPTYIQTLENDPRYSNQKIYEIINYLKNIDAISYNQEKLKNFLNTNKKNFKGKWNAKNWCKNKNIILIGPGKSVEKYKSDIENIIKIKKMLAISVNINNSINEKYISYYIASNENRIMVDINKYSKIKKPIIMPYGRVKKFFKDFKSKNIKDFGLQINENKITLHNNYCSLPNSLVFGYAIASCIVGQAKNIYLVGFDGHDMEHSTQEEMLNMIRIFKGKFSKLNLISLTPTIYPITKSSIYAKNL